MARRDTLAVRELEAADLWAVRRLLETSEYTYARFAPDELPHLLATRPAVGAFTLGAGPLGRIAGWALQAYLLINALVPPSAWLGGFGVTWTAGPRFAEYLDMLLPPIERAALARGAQTLYYSGNDLDADWMRSALEARDFQQCTTLRSYDKDDVTISVEGNQQIVVRPFTPADLPGVLAVEKAAFEQLWRYDGPGFLEVNETYPYFVVAQDGDQIVGYQFNALDAGIGYLVRIAVLPSAEGRGVGTRLMAEAVRYFARQHAYQILLNTEERNLRAHRLYERFGFHIVLPRGFVLARPIQDPVP